MWESDSSLSPEVPRAENRYIYIYIYGHVHIASTTVPSHCPRSGQTETLLLAPWFYFLFVFIFCGKGVYSCLVVTHGPNPMRKNRTPSKHKNLKKKNKVSCKILSVKGNQFIFSLFLHQKVLH